MTVPSYWRFLFYSFVLGFAVCMLAVLAIGVFDAFDNRVTYGFLPRFIDGLNGLIFGAGLGLVLMAPFWLLFILFFTGVYYELLLKKINIKSMFLRLIVNKVIPIISVAAILFTACFIGLVASGA